MTLAEGLGIAGLLLTVLSAAVAITHYFTRVQFQSQLQKADKDKDDAKQQQRDMQANVQILKQELVQARGAGAAASAQKALIEEELQTLVHLTCAKDGSVYVPLKHESSGEVSALVFLCMYPITEQTQKLQKKIIPLTSVAGQCFVEASAQVTDNMQEAKDHYQHADKVSGYNTESMLTSALKFQGHSVGVVQLLNKQGQDAFLPEDLRQLEHHAQSLAEKVQVFCQMARHMEVLGHTAPAPMSCATIMFCDLTRSSLLFQELELSAAIAHLNEYLEMMCNIAFSHGATVDKYTGDGVIFRFNVPTPIRDHIGAAMQCAHDMQFAFNQLKQDWLKMNEPFTELYNRISLASGEVKKATIGHPQYQYLTILGPTVNAAANLCDIGSRDHNSIIVDDTIKQQLGSHWQVAKIDQDKMGKASQYTSAAYEVSFHP